MALEARATIVAMSAVGKVNAGATQGPPGPDGWAEPIQTIVHSADGPLEIDYRLGKYVKLALDANVTAFTIIGWPVGYFARLQLSVTQSGNKTMAFPVSRPPEQIPLAPVTARAGAKDVFLFTTDDAGANVLSYAAGQNH